MDNVKNRKLVRSAVIKADQGLETKEKVDAGPGAMIIERPPKTSTIVADRLEDLILRQKLRPGAKLPTERSLGQQLGVSRTVLREAMKLLSARGLIQEVTGRGAFVSKPNFDAVRNSLRICLSWHAEAGIENLVELRQLIEVEIAGLAAARATQEEIGELRRNLELMESSIEGDSYVFIEVDLEFHRKLAVATHNELFVVLFDAISSAMVDTWNRMYWDMEVRRHGVCFHSKILSAVESHDAEAARNAVRENIVAYQKDVESHSPQATMSRVPPS